MKRSPLVLAIGLIAALWIARVAVTGHLRFEFLVVNVILAAIPLWLEPVFRWIRAHISGLVQRISLVCTAGVWMLFLPNAFYVLTDFMHLNSDVLVNKRNDAYSYVFSYTRGDAMYVFDSLLIFLVVAFGAYAGGLTLMHAYRYLHNRLSRYLAWLAMTVILLLSATGVYIGRYSRFNSWEGIIRPFGVTTDLIHSLQTPMAQQRFIGILATITLFEILCLIYTTYQHKKSS